MAKVLVVDDEASIRITVRAFLRRTGHQVDIAEDASEALGLLAEEDYDVVLSDVILPKISGVELLNAILETSPDVQVIMMSGEPDGEAAAKVTCAGAAAYLQKPFGRDVVQAAVDNAARKRRMLGGE